MPTKQTLAQKKKELSDYAIAAFGMRTWIADAYADICTAAHPPNHSATSTVRACTKLAQDDCGSVDPLVSSLANEVLRLNKTEESLTTNNEATMHVVLDLLGLKYAEPNEKAQLLATLGNYLKNHEFAGDGHFKDFAKVVKSAAGESLAP